MHMVLMMDCGPLTFCFCLSSLLLLVYAYSYCVDLSKKIHYVAVYKFEQRAIIVRGKSHIKYNYICIILSVVLFTQFVCYVHVSQTALPMYTLSL